MLLRSLQHLRCWFLTYSRSKNIRLRFHAFSFFLAVFNANYLEF